MVLSLHRLSEFYTAEIQRGHAGFGNYDLRSGIDVTPLQTTDGLAPLSPSTTAESLERQMEQEDAEPEIAQPETSAHDDVPVRATTIERAERIIKSGGISLDARLHVFTVMGSQEPRVVKLFPRTTCSCPAQTSCYHIAAAKLSIGMSEEKPRRPLSLTQLRKNNKKRPDKTSGRKRPRPKDVDVIPAGDADVEELQQLEAAIAAPPSRKRRRCSASVYSLPSVEAQQPAEAVMDDDSLPDPVTAEQPSDPSLNSTAAAAEGRSIWSVLRDAGACIN
jgi:hypothetical protein